MRGDGPAERAEVRVELPVDAHIPHDYVAGERLRLEAYTSIAAIDSDADIAAVTDELTDRFGPPPQAVLNLLAGGQAAGQGAAGRADRHHPAGQPHQVRASRAARVARGQGAAAVPADPAQADGAYHARTGAEGWHPARLTRRTARAVQHQLGSVTPHRRPVDARQRTARLVRGAGRRDLRRGTCRRGRAPAAASQKAASVRTLQRRLE